MVISYVTKAVTLLTGSFALGYVWGRTVRWHRQFRHPRDYIPWTLKFRHE